MGERKFYDETYVGLILQHMNSAVEAKKIDVEHIRTRFAEERRIIKEGLHKIACTFNEARDRAYKALPERLKRRGDFDTMETSAMVEDKTGQPLRILVTGVWGAVSLVVQHRQDGLYAVSTPGGSAKVVDIEGLLEELGKDLATDHPVYGEACDRELEAKKEFAK